MICDTVSESGRVNAAYLPDDEYDEEAVGSEHARVQPVSHNTEPTSAAASAAAESAAEAVSAAAVARSELKSKKLSRMEAFHKQEAGRSASLTFCRDTIMRLSDGCHLQKANIATVLSDRVRQ